MSAAPYQTAERKEYGNAMWAMGGFTNAAIAITIYHFYNGTGACAFLGIFAISQACRLVRGLRRLGRLNDSVVDGAYSVSVAGEPAVDPSRSVDSAGVTVVVPGLWTSDDCAAIRRAIESALTEQKRLRGPLARSYYS